MRVRQPEVYRISVVFQLLEENNGGENGSCDNDRRMNTRRKQKTQLVSDFSEGCAETAMHSEILETVWNVVRTSYVAETFWAGLSFILSPYAALLAENAEIRYFGVDWSMWYRRTTKTVVWRVVECVKSFEVAQKGEIRQERSKQDETKEAEMKTRDVTLCKPRVEGHGTVTSDGSIYNIHESQRINETGASFSQYWSIRQSPQNTGYITIGNHFAAWAALGMPLGKFESRLVAVESDAGSRAVSVWVLACAPEYAQCGELGFTGPSCRGQAYSRHARLPPIAANAVPFFRGGMYDRDGEEIEGCSVVMLHDSAQDVTFCLRAIFDSSFFEPPPAKTDLAAILRLNHKYDMQYSRRRALLHLDTGYPTSMAVYETVHVLFKPNKNSVHTFLKGKDASWGT
ncbi:hypothetical protein B0H13DRAFT_1865837 [Mycena leptocephala]|nr:hypothetical protein B0H13DRAFT_1865837 [Mycena leptocephala]